MGLGKGIIHHYFSFTVPLCPTPMPVIAGALPWNSHRSQNWGFFTNPGLLAFSPSFCAFIGTPTHSSWLFPLLSSAQPPLSSLHAPSPNIDCHTHPQAQLESHKARMLGLTFSGLCVTWPACSSPRVSGLVLLDLKAVQAVQELLCHTFLNAKEL